MMTPIRKVALIFIAALFCCAVHAEVIKVEGQGVWIRLNGKTVSVGEQLDVIDASGRKDAVIKITKVYSSSAYAEIESGQAQVGMKVARHASATVMIDGDSKVISSNNSFDLRLNPIGVIGGNVSANFDFKISKHLTLGPQGLYLHVKIPQSGFFNSDYDITAFGYGLRANWFFKGAFKDGFYLGPSLEYLTVNLKTSDAFGAATGTASGLMASCLIGYGWFWDGFNIMLAGGYGTVLGASGITIKDSVGNQEIISENLSGFTYELSFGWAF
jgi:hypothetical protein